MSILILFLFFKEENDTLPLQVWCPQLNTIENKRSGSEAKEECSLFS